MKRLTTIGALGCLVVASCGGPGQAGGSAGKAAAGVSVADTPELPTPANATAKVTYQDRAVVFDRATWKRELKTISDDDITYTFDGASVQAQRLQPGKTLFLYGRAFRKVSRVQGSGGRIVVTTENAALTDLIKDGTLKWKQEVDVSHGFVSQSTSTDSGANGRLQASPSAASPTDAPTTDPGASPDNSPVSLLPGQGSEMLLTGADGAQRPAGYRLAADAEPIAITIDGYKLAVAYTPAADRINMTLTASKDFGAGTVSLEGKGFIKRFSQSSDIEIQSGHLQSYSQQANGVTAEMTISWLSKKDGPGQMASTTILKPSVSYNLPFMVGGIPMFGEVAMNSALIPAFSTQGTAKASFKVSYTGNQGIDFNQGTMAGSETHSGNFSIENSSLISPSIISMSALLAYPKITVGIGWRKPGFNFSGSEKGAAQGVSAAGWSDLLLTMSAITTGLVNAGTGTSCTKTSFVVEGRIGMELKIFGIDLPTPAAKTVFTKEIKEIVPPGSPLCLKV